MGLFDGKSKEEKQAEKIAKILAKYGLEDISDPRDLQAVQEIADELAGSKWMETGMALSMSAKTEDQRQVMFQRVLMEQNWIIIRQLDRLNRNLERR